MWSLVQEGLVQRFHGNAAVGAALPSILAAVEAGELPASVAAARLLEISA
jgi:hypothetical protein